MSSYMFYSKTWYITWLVMWLKLSAGTHKVDGGWMFRQLEPVQSGISNPYPTGLGLAKLIRAIDQ